MAFQLTDDVLDYTAPPEQSGKDLANDLRQGKATLPLLLACEEDKELLSEVENIAAKEPTQKECLEVVRRVLATSAVDRALIRAEGYVQEARKKLEAFQDGQAQESLYELAGYIIGRVKLS